MEAYKLEMVNTIQYMTVIPYKNSQIFNNNERCRVTTLVFKIVKGPIILKIKYLNDPKIL